MLTAAFEVNAGPAGAQGADQLRDQALALEFTGPTDDGQAGVEVEGEGVVSGLDDQAFEVHAATSTDWASELEWVERPMFSAEGPLEQAAGAARVRSRSGRPRASTSRAPLAQSAERFHGKEKVESSILSGGST